MITVQTGDPSGVYYVALSRPEGAVIMREERFATEAGAALAAPASVRVVERSDSRGLQTVVRLRWQPPGGPSMEIGFHPDGRVEVRVEVEE